MANSRKLISMAKYLLLYLTDQTAETAHWMLIDEAREKTESQEPCLLSDCPKPDPQTKTKTIILFPSEHILLTTVSLPPAKKSQQSQAALFALEEKLAEDVLDLHAVIFNQNTSGLYSVGIIRTALLEDWLQKFEAANIKVDFLLPDVFAVPYQADHWVSLHFNHRVLVRTDLSQGFAVPENHYDLLLNKQEHPDIIVLDKNQLGETIQTVLSYNILQGKYRPKTQFHEIKKIWALPALLCIIWLVLLLGLTIAKYTILSAESARLDTQISTLYNQAYPESTAVISPRLRIERDIHNLKNAKQNEAALDLIAQTGNILKNIPKTLIENLSYQGNTLKINIETEDFQSLEKIVTLLEKDHLQVKQSNAARAGKHVTATLSITLSTLPSVIPAKAGIQIK